MLSEKNTLREPLLPWFTGCSAGSPGQRLFCSSASISVPGAPASSLRTRSQELASNDGAEICDPGAVAVALLATRQPCAPRLAVSLAPAGPVWPVTPGPDAPIEAAQRKHGAAPVPWVACAPGASHTSDVAAQASEAPMAKGGRRTRFTAGNS